MFSFEIFNLSFTFYMNFDHGVSTTDLVLHLVSTVEQLRVRKPCLWKSTRCGRWRNETKHASRDRLDKNCLQLGLNQIKLFAVVFPLTQLFPIVRGAGFRVVNYCGKTVWVAQLLRYINQAQCV